MSDDLMNNADRAILSVLATSPEDVGAISQVLVHRTARTAQARIADLERQLAEARTVVGEEELVEIAAKAQFVAYEMVGGVTEETASRWWEEYKASTGTAEQETVRDGRRCARAVLNAVATPIAAAERERCAKVCDEMQFDVGGDAHLSVRAWFRFACQSCTVAIRALAAKE